MLQISQVQMEALQDAGMRRFAQKVDGWLASVSSAWSRLDPAPRQAALEDMVRLGRASGLEVETDYALFAWILAHLRGDWRAFVKRAAVKDLLAAEGGAQGKVVSLHDLAKAELVADAR